ncbi:hypothetical protein D0Y65_043080 [Glycine soja]|uniref:Uncharacterized protein n=2 Tax=Glycine subgen. Soja TaxID=1462606 RepID=K7MFZ0_SOYBN|nr:hypothetical protein D0Y65_043080 [Glycine soja]
MIHIAFLTVGIDSYHSNPLISNLFHATQNLSNFLGWIGLVNSNSTIPHFLLLLKVKPACLVIVAYCNRI